MKNKNVMSFSVVVLAVTLRLIHFAQATVYNPTADFSITNGNPNGVWTYGWMNTSFTTFTPYVNFAMSSGGLSPEWYGWASDWSPCIWRDDANTTADGQMPGWLNLHPGPGTEPCVLRWRASTPGFCNLAGQFLPGNYGTMLVGVRHNTNWLWQATNSGSFTCGVNVVSGDMIDFLVYGGYGAGTTPLQVTIDGPRPALTRYVNASSVNPLPPYLSWATAANTIQDAVSLSQDYDTVLVADGTYATGGATTPSGTLSSRVCVSNFVTVRSVNGAAKTLIQGAANTRCVYLGGGGRLEGFTLSGGQTKPSGALADTAGGGACVVSGTVARCIVRNNAATTGGGLYLAAGSAAENSLVVTNMSTGPGGGVAFDNGGTLTHSTVAANVAGGSGGGAYLNGNGTVRNTILYGNTATSGNNWTVSGGGTFATVCTTPTVGLPNATGCFADDPAFLSPTDYRLPKTSPCVDAVVSLTGQATDLLGMPRVADGDGDGVPVADLGCYERWERAPFIAALDENAQLYVADWNAASNAFVNYRFIGAWRVSEGTAANTRSCAIADFNEDGHDDIVIGRYMFYQSGGYTLFLNDGTNGFVRQEAPALSMLAEDWLQEMTAGDFDNDSHQDFLAHGNTGSLTFFKGDGAGHFKAQMQDGLEWRSRGLDTADFDHDGSRDLVRAAYSSGNLRYYKGLGDGTFGTYSQIADVGDDPYAVTAGDFDLDGHPDVMVNAGSSGDIRFFKGLGNGTFTTGVAVATLDINRHSAFDAYDFDGDGDLDIVTATYDARSILFFRNDGTGTNFAAAVSVGTTPNNVMCIAAPPHLPSAFLPSAAPTGAVPTVADTTLFYGETEAVNGFWPLSLSGAAFASDPEGLTAFDWDVHDARNETFEDGTMGRWRPLNGSWGVTTNLPLSGRYSLRQSNASADRARILYDYPVNGDFEMEADFQYRSGSGQECIFVLAANGYSDGYEVIIRGRGYNDLRLDRAGTILSNVPLGYTPQAYRIYHFKAVRRSGWLHFWIDDRLLMSFHDASLLTGLCGFTDYYCETLLDNVKIRNLRQANRTAYAPWTDDFEDGKAEDWMNWAGTWNVTNTAPLAGSYSLHQTDTGNDRARFMNRRILPFGVAASADVRMTGGTGEEVHFHFGSRSSDTRLECIFRGRGYNDILVNRRVDGSEVWTGSLPLPFPIGLNKTYHLRAEWNLSDVTFWIGTNELVKVGSFTVSTGITDGMAGLCSYRTAAIFDNVRFEPLAFRPSLTQTFGFGTNLVSLTAYDTEGQAATGTVTLVMQRGDVPTAVAGGPYSVDELTGQVDNNGWLVTLNGSGSSDPTSPTNRLTYLWDLGTELFTGMNAVTGKWIFSSAGISQSNALSITGAGSWGTRYAFTRAAISRAEGTAFQAKITPPATCHAMVGLKNTTATYSYSAMPYCFYFHDSDYIEIYEDGTSRGRVALYTPGLTYEVRIDLKAGTGARYYLRPSGTADWQLLYDSGYGTTTSFLRGLDVNSGTVLFDDLRELAPGQFVPWRFYGTNTFTATLIITDPTGVADTDSTTVTTTLNNPPIANGGIDVTQNESNAVERVWTFTFNADGSTDDRGILSYEWDFNYDGTFDPSGVTGVSVTHTWTEPGVYIVAVRVTDHAMQTSVDTVTVTVTIGAPPTPNPGTPYSVNEFSGNASNGAWTVTLDGSGSSDPDSSLVRSVWSIGEETFVTNLAMREKWFYSSDAHITNGVLTFDWFSGTADSGHYCFTHDRYPRVNGMRAETRIRFINTDQEIAFGFKNDNETSTHWNQWVYGLHNHNGTLYFMEGGTHTSLSLAVAANVWYDWRIELKAGSGARYYVKRADETAWTLVRDSTYSSDTWFRRGYHNYHGSFEADSYQEYTAGIKPLPYRVYVPNTNNVVSLTVWDQALQTNTAYTTLTCLKNAPPVAEAGPDRTGDETTCTEGVWFFTFDASGSTDDHGIYTYEWDWDYDGTFEPSGDTDLKVQHGFAVSRLGTNTVAVRVTDHVLQQHVDTCRVILSAGEPPVADAGPDLTVETGWPLVFDGTRSHDDMGVSRYEWNFGDGVAGTGPRPRHIYRSSAPTNYTVVLTVYDTTEQVSAPSTTLVSVVTSTVPKAEAGGPYSAGVNGPPAYFDASASSDALDTNVVQGVAKYLWDIDTATDSDGDGTTDNDVDLIGRRAFNVYTNFGTFTCKLTVVDAAGQSDWDLTTVNVASNLAPHVICVPLHGNPDSPHLVYSGKQVTLKGIVRDAGTLTYSWDFGDGTTSAVATVTDKFAIQALHTYSGLPDRPFIARLTVWDANRLAGTDEYKLVMRPDNQATRADIAVDEGLWWLHKNQNRTYGYWNNPTEGNTGYRPSAASGAVQALLTNGHRPEGDPTEDPYVETVNRGFDYLFSLLQTRTMTVQPAGNPDTNGNGIGLEVNTTHRGYQQGMVIDAIASTQYMLGMARTGIAGVKGSFYFDIVIDMMDALIFGQCDTSSSDRGGWRYDWNAGTSDNSISQWGAVSLLAADNNFGIRTPSWVKDENKRWLAYSFVSGAYCYRPGEQYPWSETAWHSTQPSALIQMAINNIYVTNATWRTAEITIADNWNSVYGSAANRNYYSLYALVKAMRLARPRPVTYLEKSFLDWYSDPSNGVQQKVTAHQSTDGSWSAWYRDNGSGLNTDLSTAWAVMMLTPTLFSQAPVPVITAPNVWGFGVPMLASAENSFHIDATRTIVKYEWDFNGDGVYDYATASPTDPNAVWTYPDPTPGVPGDPPVQYTIRLRVTDDNTPAQTALTTFTLTVAEPPHAPYAEPGGPYSCYVNEPIVISGAGSYDIDPSDFITRYEWDFNLDGTADSATMSPVTNLLYATAGERVIALRVWDNGVMNGGTNLVSEWSYTLIDVWPFDSDGDGISDKWERSFWNNLTTASATSDSDQDGSTDLSEYRAGTDPTSPLSKFVIESVALFLNEDAGVDITWRSVTSRLYRVDRSTNLLLQGLGFQPFTSNVPGQVGSTTVNDPTPPVPPVYYRIHTETP